MGWSYDEHFATGTLNKGITVKGVFKPGPSRECGEAIKGHLRNDGRNKTGNNLQVNEQWVEESNFPDFGTRCAKGCVEVDFGNEDTSQ